MLTCEEIVPSYDALATTVKTIAAWSCPVVLTRKGTPSRRGSKFLGSGVCRKVYALNKGLVLKLARRGFEYCNLAEAVIWNHVKGTYMEPNFAEVFAVASDGSWLIMEYVQGECDETEDSTELEELGLNDMHADNYRIVDGTLVAIDYAGYLNCRGDALIATMEVLARLGSNRPCQCSECMADRS